MWTEKYAILEDPVSKSEAIDVYQNLMFDAGLDSEFALRANVGIGDVHTIGGRVRPWRLPTTVGMVDMVLPPDPGPARGSARLVGARPRRQRAALRVRRAGHAPGIQQSARAVGELRKSNCIRAVPLQPLPRGGLLAVPVRSRGAPGDRGNTRQRGRVHRRRTRPRARPSGTRRKRR